MPTVTQSPGWDRRTGSETRPRKTGFRPRGATYLSKSFPREKPPAFLGPGRSKIKSAKAGETRR